MAFNYFSVFMLQACEKSAILGWMDEGQEYVLGRPQMLVQKPGAKSQPHLANKPKL